MSHNALPKETAAHIQTTFFSFMFVVCLRSVEQTNCIIAKCEWCKFSREKACGANTRENFWLLFHAARRQKWVVFAGYHHDRRKQKINESPKYKCFMCSSLCSANERIYIFWKCQIVSVNQELNAFYRLKSGGKRTKSGIQNLLSTNRAKLLDFLIPLLN